MPGTSMAEPPRRRGPGHLAETILLLLQRSQAPLTGIEIAERLRLRDRRVSNSLVFRALLLLRRDGAIRKIEHRNCYAAGGETRVVSLVCATCGRLEVREDEAFFQALGGVARLHGFRPSRYIVEFPGICGRCSESAG
jgi:Fe2+ or Zn2+ uptake regulation protein